MPFAGNITLPAWPRTGLAQPWLLPGAVLLASLLLGGGTRAGFLADAALQALSIPVLLVAIHRWQHYRTGSREADSVNAALALAAGLVSIHLVQLVPLPHELWSWLPARQEVVWSLELIGADRPWLPISVAPDTTWLALLSLIPALAVFAATLQLDYASRRQLVTAVVAFAAVSAVLGLLQVVQGPGSRLRPFEITNVNEAVGFFANRNHFAALMYAGLAWLAAMMATGGSRDGASAAGVSKGFIVATTGCFVAALLIFAAILAARSRAGLALMFVAIAGGTAAALTMPTQVARPSRGIWSVLAAAILVVALSGPLVLSSMLDRLATDPTADARLPFGRNTIAAALDFMPFGSGAGSFVPVYATYEKVADATSAYANRAHNDFLEAWLETGAAGMVIVAGFLVWLGLRAHAVWRGALPGAGRSDVTMARAAAIVVAMLVLHSLVDYPLRTAALSSLLAFCCALLLPPPPALRQRARPTGIERRAAPAWVGQSGAAAAVAPRPFAPAVAIADRPLPPQDRGGDGGWPEEWRGGANATRASRGHPRDDRDGGGHR